VEGWGSCGRDLDLVGRWTVAVSVFSTINRLGDLLLERAPGQLERGCFSEWTVLLGDGRVGMGQRKSASGKGHSEFARNWGWRSGGQEFLEAGRGVGGELCIWEQRIPLDLYRVVKPQGRVQGRGRRTGGQLHYHHAFLQSPPSLCSKIGVA